MIPIQTKIHSEGTNDCDNLEKLNNFEEKIVTTHAQLIDIKTKIFYLQGCWEFDRTIRRNFLVVSPNFRQGIRLKGEVSRKFDVISKPKNVDLTTEPKNNCLVLL